MILRGVANGKYLGQCGRLEDFGLFLFFSAYWMCEVAVLLCGICDQTDVPPQLSAFKVLPQLVVICSQHRKLCDILCL